MIPVLKLPLAFDPGLLQKDLRLFGSEEWTPHFNTAYYEGDWSGIALRAAKNSLVSIYPDPAAQDGYEYTASLDRCSYIPNVLNAFKCETESVRLLKLAAGSQILEHQDYCLGFENGFVRIHIPIETDQDVHFFLNGHRVEMIAGEAWYLNFNLKHRVANNSRKDRVHLVIDCVLNDWLRSYFPAAD
jgi:hypothetical protein